MHMVTMDANYKKNKHRTNGYTPLDTRTRRGIASLGANGAKVIVDANGDISVSTSVTKIYVESELSSPDTYSLLRVLQIRGLIASQFFAELYLDPKADLSAVARENRLVMNSKDVQEIYGLLNAGKLDKKVGFKIADGSLIPYLLTK